MFGTVTNNLFSHLGVRTCWMRSMALRWGVEKVFIQLTLEQVLCVLHQHSSGNWAPFSQNDIQKQHHTATMG